VAGKEQVYTVVSFSRKELGSFKSNALMSDKDGFGWWWTPIRTVIPATRHLFRA
jgi:hypothetical protein